MLSQFLFHILMICGYVHAYTNEVGTVILVSEVHEHMKTLSSHVT